MQYDIPELKELALAKIQQDLSKCNIVEEVFSKYTSWSVVIFSLWMPDFSLVGRYPELRELEIRELARTLLSSNSGPTLKSLKKKINRYTHGQLAHGRHIISVLYELMEGDASVEETPLPEAATSNQHVDGDWTGLKRALTSSLTSGTFLDSQFYAVEPGSSTDPPKVRPVYFCSTVGGSFISKLMACKPLPHITCG